MRFQIHHSPTSCLPNTCMILHMIAKLKIFVTFFSGTTIQGFLKFGFRVYISQLYCVMRFQIHHLTTSCLPNTCIILSKIAKLKIFITIFSGTTIQGFLKFGFKVYISQLYCVMHFQSHHSINFCLLNTYFTLLILSTCSGGIISEQ